LQDLGAMSGVSDQSEAGAITDSGLVTGTFVTSGSVQAFIWDSANGMRKVAPLSAEGRATMGHAINSAGRIAGVGSSYLRPGFPSNVGRAISADLQILSVLPDLPGRPAGHSTDDSTAYGINDSNDVVGWTLDASGARAVIWGYKFGLRALNDRIHPCDPLRQSVVLSDARAINNGGEIAAVGSIGGVAHAFLLRNAWTVWTANCQPVITRPPKTLSTAPP
jgi:hypothetical protein